MIIFQSLTQVELADLLLPLSQAKVSDPTKAFKQSRYRAKMLFKWVYVRHVLDWEQMTDLSKDVRAWLHEHVQIYRLTEEVSRQSLDGTHKFLWTLPDHKTIESVIIPAALQEKEGDHTEENSGNERLQATPRAPAVSKGVKFGVNVRDLSPSLLAGQSVEHDESAMDSAAGRWSRLTACISSQVGCAMACKFCLTGIQGLDRSLTAHEIVAQVHELRMRAPITNIVFMGMGEPLHNVEAVAKACEIMLDADGLSFSKRKITVSTSGLVPGIDELGKRVDVSLAISLNASNDEQRSQIMPVNKRWNIAELLAACKRYPLGPHRRITFEYVMLKDFNDTVEDAARVFKLLKGIPNKVNLIPFNEHPGSEFKRPTDEKVRAFQRYLLDRNMTTTVRISRGRDILAACGQLRSIFGSARGTEKHKDWEQLKVST